MNHLIFAIALSDPAALLKAWVRLLHLIGIVIGLGAATVLDLVILRFIISDKITDAHASLVEFCSKIVTAGLALLWLSGAAFLLHYYAFEPDKLGNEKVWAKIAIVGILTLNGYFIHVLILPLVRARVGYSLFEGLPLRPRVLLLTCGAVSATSWHVPLLLGAFPQLNFVVPATTILLAYAVILCGAVAITQVIAHVLLRSPPTSPVKVRDLRSHHAH